MLCFHHFMERVCGYYPAATYLCAIFREDWTCLIYNKGLSNFILWFSGLTFHKIGGNIIKYNPWFWTISADLLREFLILMIWYSRKLSARSWRRVGPQDTGANPSWSVLEISLLVKHVESLSHLTCCQTQSLVGWWCILIFNFLESPSSLLRTVGHSWSCLLTLCISYIFADFKGIINILTNLESMSRLDDISRLEVL